MNRGYNYVYNHRQLKRWGIDPALIPSEAVIKFQPSSIYRQYKTELLIMALVFLLLTGALISSVWISHQRKAYNKELASKANQDPLTGIFNRRHFMALATQTVGKSNRREMNACMLMLDLDYFKEVNDKLGHDAGDRVLTELARLFSSTLRADDIFARFGGEEFIFLLPNTTLDQGKIVAEKLRYNAEKYAGPDGIQVTVSIGIAILNSDIELAIKQADIALYNAKEKGRNRVDMYC